MWFLTKKTLLTNGFKSIFKAMILNDLIIEENSTHIFFLALNFQWISGVFQSNSNTVMDARIYLGYKNQQKFIENSKIWNSMRSALFWVILVYWCHTAQNSMLMFAHSCFRTKFTYSPRATEGHIHYCFRTSTAWKRLWQKACGVCCHTSAHALHSASKPLEVW